MNTGAVLTSDVELFTAMLSQTAVIVWAHGEVLDNGGIIQGYDSLTVKIDDSYYLRAICEFRIQ